MPLILGSTAALMTIFLGLVSTVYGVYVCRKRQKETRIIGSFISYGFSATPIIILLWNCIALLCDHVFFDGTAKIVLSGDVNSDLVLIGWATIYSLFHITNDLVQTAR